MNDRQTYLANITLQFGNPLYPPQFGAPLLITTAEVLVNEKGEFITNPQQIARAAIARDITDELFEAIRARLADVGLQVSRMPPAKELELPAAGAADNAPE